MSSKRPRRESKGDVAPDAVLYLREHAYVIATADQYFDFQKRVRHARYGLDSLECGRIYGGGVDGLDAYQERIGGLRQRFEETELKASPPTTTDGPVMRPPSEPMDAAQFRRLTEGQVKLWQETELLLAEIHELMAGSVEGEVLTSNARISDLQTMIGLQQFHISKRMDRAPLLRTLVFELDSDEPFEVSYEDHEPRRRRAEEWYRQALDAWARVLDAQRKEKDSVALIRLTWLIAILTIIVAVLTAGSLWTALFVH